MRTPFSAGLWALVCATTVFAEPVEIGMTEARLISLKGTPQSKAVVGQKAIYRWPDMQVNLVAGKVDQIQYTVQVPSSQKAAPRPSTGKRETGGQPGKVKPEKATVVNPDGPPTTFRVEVVEVLKQGGAIVDLLTEGSVLGPVSSSRAIGAGGPDPQGSKIFRLSGRLAYMAEIKDCVDGERFEVSAASAGKYSYGQNTLRRFIVYQATKK